MQAAWQAQPCQADDQHSIQSQFRRSRLSEREKSLANSPDHGAPMMRRLREAGYVVQM